MTLRQIQAEFEKGRSKLHAVVDAKCAARSKVIVAGLKNFEIARINFGNGTFAWIGKNFRTSYTDDDQVEYGSSPLSDLTYWIEDKERYLWQPAKMLKQERVLLEELVDLCYWWVDQTGGCDVSFAN